MVEHYVDIMQALWPTGTFQGTSYSVMDTTFGQSPGSSMPAYSIELFFPSIDVNGRAVFIDFVEAAFATINAATDTFLTGYVSLRFTGSTRAFLGMQQWTQTCAVEISVVQGVQNELPLLTNILDMVYQYGGLPHWGQMIDLNVKGHGSLYPGYAQWRSVYAKLSNNFTTRTFENALSNRWQLTSPYPLNATFIGQNMASVLQPSQTFSASVTMNNTGLTTWTAGGNSPYKLGSQNPQDNTTWGLNRVALPTFVPPGASVTFTFTVTAPTQPGSYNFQ